MDGYLISTVIELPGCHTQAKTYDELYVRTKEAIELYLDDNKKFKPLNSFVGLQQILV
ncbi:MAG: type II toxin-antitoxin system HicB family antitoxin [Bacteroidales bacterium]|nr:type II toxin-antitoxin system HicB family antitoxin [Bacteroidales bacterium]